ncbi:MAG: outer membrane lipoprotein chaperone LolA [Proteobacteria bacterium]|nr:outer membrane lipoprotein chaperone LolA [Pseudomonadota bacterium]MCP4921914.1 outer membrane lipoprotein chaperone LolA [Pseudomonadota bacterium]
MIRLFASLLIAAGLMVSWPSWAQDDVTVEQVVTGIESTYGDVQSLRADFVQVNRSAVGETKIKGRVEMARPRLMKWDSTKSPQGTMFVTDGSKMWIYTPSDKTVLVYNDVSAAGGAVPLDLLDSLEKLDEHFVVELRDANGGKDKKSLDVKLTPKTEGGNYKEIRLLLTKKNYQLKQFTLVDQFGTETEFSFTQVKLNPEMDASEFVFTPPAGVETIVADGI